MDFLTKHELNMNFYIFGVKKFILNSFKNDKSVF